MTRQERVHAALRHQRPDRTPLFEIFQPFQPIHWEVCGRNLATDEALAWDARAAGVPWEEQLEASAQAQFRIARHFDLDMVRLNGAPPRDQERPRRLAPGRWLLQDVEYVVNPRTHLVGPKHPGAQESYSNRVHEDELRRRIEAWQPASPDADLPPAPPDPLLARVRQLAAGLDLVFMGEIGAGTGVAFYPPCLLMWMLDEPELYRRWLAMQQERAFAATRRMIAAGCEVIAMGGDVSCDKGPFISPALYREFVLPVIQDHVRLIHDAGALAVYTSDGNNWPIKDDFFFHSGADGYKEVDNAAGMTWPRLIEEGVADSVCIIGNTDARHLLCHGTPVDVRREVQASLRYGLQTRGGHILHNSHSVHEDVIPANYHAVVAAYRDFFGLPPLP